MWRFAGDGDAYIYTSSDSDGRSRSHKPTDGDGRKRNRSPGADKHNTTGNAAAITRSSCPRPGKPTDAANPSR
jgi:hypothetical protein